MSKKKLSEEHKKKLSLAKLKNPVKYWLGKKRLDMIGNKNPMNRPEIKNKFIGRKQNSKWIRKRVKTRLKNNNFKHSDATKIKLSLNNCQRRPEVRKKTRISVLKYIHQNKGFKIGKNEKQYLDELELHLNKKIIRQYPIIGYAIDGYIPELNLAIEIDELRHFKNDNIKQKDKKRQKEIEDELSCKFLRIRDNAK